MTGKDGKDRATASRQTHEGGARDKSDRNGDAPAYGISKLAGALEWRSPQTATSGFDGYARYF